MSGTIAERIEEVRAKFASFSDPDDKWKYLLDLARAHQGMDASLKDEKFIHLDIAPYDELKHEQKKDLLLVSNIPYILTGKK